MKLNNVHLVVSAFAAAAGVVFAAIQTFGTGNSPPPPVTVTLAVDPAKAAKPDDANQTVAKSQDADAINTAVKANGGLLQPVATSTGGKAIDLANTGRFSSALKDEFSIALCIQGSVRRTSGNLGDDRSARFRR